MVFLHLGPQDFDQLDRTIIISREIGHQLVCVGLIAPLIGLVETGADATEFALKDDTVVLDGVGYAERSGVGVPIDNVAGSRIVIPTRYTVDVTGGI